MRIVDAFKERNPWAAAAVSLIFSPVVSCLYLGKGMIAGFYFVANLSVYFIVLTIPSLMQFLQPADALTVVSVVGSFHCYFLARNKDSLNFEKWYARWRELLIFCFILPILVAVLFRIFLFETFSIPASSMKPTSYVGDIFLSEKFAYGYSRYSTRLLDLNFDGRILSRGKLPQRGEVVTFRLPTNTAVDYIKRVIGLPGDTVQMKDGRLYINHLMVMRRALGSKEVDRDGKAISVTEYIETLPDGFSHHIYEESDYGPLDTTQEYTVPEGHYFMLGDNRDKSMDSRVMDHVGFVPLINITGRGYRIIFRDHKITWLSFVSERTGTIGN